MNIAALGPKPRTMKSAPGHKIFLYPLRGLIIDRSITRCGARTYLDWFELRGRVADPERQHRTLDGEPLSGKHLSLPVERQMPAYLAASSLEAGYKANASNAWTLTCLHNH